MPYKINWEKNGVYIKWDGIITVEDNIKSNGEMYGKSIFDNIDYQIADFLDADFSYFNEKEASVIGKLELKASTWNKNIKVAHITKNTDVIKLIKNYESQMEDSGWEFMIFDTIEKARIWVNSLSGK